jgi:hypothetical protein
VNRLLRQRTLKKVMRCILLQRVMAAVIFQPP